MVDGQSGRRPGALEPATEPTGLALVAAPTPNLTLRAGTALDHPWRSSSAYQNTATVRKRQEMPRYAKIDIISNSMPFFSFRYV